MTYNCRYCGRKTRRSPVFVPGARVSTAGRAWQWAVLALCLCAGCAIAALSPSAHSASHAILHLLLLLPALEQGYRA